MVLSSSALPNRTCVLIVGAGPTGLTLAAALARRGVPFAILDKRNHGSTTSRGAVIHARTISVLDSLGLATGLLEHGITAPRFTMRQRGRPMLSVSFADLPGPHGYSVIVPQNVTEELFRDFVVGTGNPVYGGSEVIDLVVPTAAAGGDAAETVVVLERNGYRQQIAAQFVVGCDGRQSRVRELVGIGFSGARYQQRFEMADVTMDWPLPRDGIDLFLSKQGLMVVFPLPQDRFRLIATVDPGQADVDSAADGSAHRIPAADLQRLLDSRGPTARKGGASSRPILGEVLWSSRFSIENRLADTFRSGHVFLAGDAAHVYSPAGGQGMNLGIRDAAELGTVLADVVDGRRGPEHLDAYEARRRPLAQQVVALTDRMTKAVTTVNPVKRTIRNSVLTVAGCIPAVPRVAAATLSGYREPQYD
jgi:2-polyprenyl-6-methoxyphenol hydroxylase-like FAD-dependent oxidoreductase